MRDEATHLQSVCLFNLSKLVCILAFPKNSRILLHSKLMQIHFCGREKSRSTLIYLFSSHYDEIILVFFCTNERIQAYWRKNIPKLASVCEQTRTACVKMFWKRNLFGIWIAQRGSQWKRTNKPAQRITQLFSGAKSSLRVLTVSSIRSRLLMQVSV